jgi:hypothetical protein
MNAIRKSTTTPEMYFQIREPHTSKKGKAFKAATAFARQDHEGAWNATLVRCSIEDNYCRKAGRTIAKRRFFNGTGTVVKFDAAPTHEQIVALYKDI